MAYIIMYDSCNKPFPVLNILISSSPFYNDNIAFLTGKNFLFDKGPVLHSPAVSASIDLLH